MARKVTIDTPWGESYRGTVVKRAHSISVNGRDENVYAVQAESGYRYARASWIRRGRRGEAV